MPSIMLETEHHMMEIESQLYVTIKRYCQEKNITLDYFMFEFMNFDPESGDGNGIYPA